MLNPNHTTTDEELKNARIEFSDAGSSFEDLEDLAEADNTTILPHSASEDNDTTTAANNTTSIKKESPVPNPYDVVK